jgi:hypothetical protein
LYEKGLGVDQDYYEAARLYTLAANTGHAPALCNLGSLFARGLDEMHDDRGAVQLFSLAADQGLAQAQCNLGYVNYSFL